MIRQLITAGFYLRCTISINLPKKLLNYVQKQTRSVLEQLGKQQSNQEVCAFVILTVQTVGGGLLEMRSESECSDVTKRAHVCVTHYRRITANQTSDLCGNLGYKYMAERWNSSLWHIPAFSAVATKEERAMSRPPFDDAFSRTATCNLRG